MRLAPVFAFACIAMASSLACDRRSNREPSSGSLVVDRDGVRARPSDDQQALDVELAGQPPIRIAVLKECGRPAVGAPAIRAVDFLGDRLSVTYGKHCSATVALPAVTLHCDGCD